MNTCFKGYANFWLKPFAVCHYFTMFGGHWSSAIGDIKYFICHVTSQYHVIDGSCNFIRGRSSWKATNQQILVIIVIGLKYW